MTECFQHTLELTTKDILKHGCSFISFSQVQEIIASADQEKLRCDIRKIPYKDFLLTRYWAYVRDIAIKKAGYRCMLCNGTKTLQVHHRTYEHHGQEHLFPDDLVCLCRGCHEGYHGAQKKKNKAEKRAPRKYSLSGYPKKTLKRLARKSRIPLCALKNLPFDKIDKLLEINGLGCSGHGRRGGGERFYFSPTRRIQGVQEIF